MPPGQPIKGYREPDGPDIPLRPLQDWVERQIAMGVGVCDLAERMGVTDRTLRRVRHGQRTIKVLNPATRRRRHVTVVTEVWGRWRVEDMLDRAGVDFYDVYPQFAHEQDPPLEPDAWCSTCREVVTPVHGFCLWCDEPVSKPQAEAA